MENRITFLETEIKKHQELYYSGKAEISDSEFDKLWEELEFLDPNNAILDTPSNVDVDGSDSDSDIVVRKKPMLSLEKTKEIPKLKEWADGKELFCTFKLDGCSCELDFSGDGSFVASTRGDGYEGKNITQKMLLVQNIPEVMKSCVVRGEVVVHKEAFPLLLKEMELLKLDKPKSLRNIVAGLLGRKDNIELCKYLDFVAYDLSETFTSESDKFAELIKMQFCVPNYELIPAVGTGINEAVKSYEENLADYPYLTDGLVFAYNKTILHVGMTGHHPKYKMAFKLKSQTAQTVVKNVEFDIGRTGKLTLVANIEPVELASSTLRRVTLHNYAYAIKHSVWEGSVIEVTRSNEVIPKHVMTVSSKLNPIEISLLIPENCPICGCMLASSGTGVDLICENINCKARKIQTILYQLKTLGVKNISDKTVAKLYDALGWQDIYAFIKMDGVSRVLSLEGFKEKSVQNMIADLAVVKKIDVATLIQSAAFSNVGKSVSKDVSKTISNEKDLMNITKEQLLSIDGIGDEISNSFDNKALIAHYEALKAVGVEIIFGEKVVDIKENILKGAKFIISGKCTRKKDDIYSTILLYGGEQVSTVSKCDYLITNETGTGKCKDAAKLGKKVISEEEFFKIIG